VIDHHDFIAKLSGLTCVFGPELLIGMFETANGHGKVCAQVIFVGLDFRNR
jgi:hypothetical protein